MNIEYGYLALEIPLSWLEHAVVIEWSLPISGQVDGDLLLKR